MSAVCKVNHPGIWSHSLVSIMYTHEPYDAVKLPALVPTLLVCMPPLIPSPSTRLGNDTGNKRPRCVLREQEKRQEETRRETFLCICHRVFSIVKSKL